MSLKEKRQSYDQVAKQEDRLQRLIDPQTKTATLADRRFE